MPEEELDGLLLVDVAMLVGVEDEPPGAAVILVVMVDELPEVEDAVAKDVTVADC